MARLAKKAAIKKIAKTAVKKVTKPIAKKIVAKKAAAKTAPKKMAKPALKSAVIKKPKPMQSPKKVSASTTRVKIPKPMSKTTKLMSGEYTEASILKAPAADYMNRAMLEFFKKRLLAMQEETLEHIEAVRRELATEEPQADELDKAVLEEERMLKLRVIERESKLLPKIQIALRKISNGTYGYCEETDEPIGVPRLLLRPTATFSVEAKEFLEQKEKEFSTETQ